MSASAQTSDLPTIGVMPPTPQTPLERDASADGQPPPPAPLALEHTARERISGPGRDRPLSEQPTAALLGRIARLEGSLGAALSLLRRCMVERKTPTRDALAAEAGFALGMAPDAALAELDEVAQLVGVSSLR